MHYTTDERRYVVTTACLVYVKRVFSIAKYDAQGRSIATYRYVGDNMTSPATAISQAASGGVYLGGTEYGSVGKVEAVYDEHQNFTFYSYDENGNLAETANYDSSIPANLLSVTRNLYDKEGRVVVTVGPYEPAVYDGAAANWPVGTETVYDELGRVAETRRWAGVKVYLEPFKVVNGQALACAEDAPEMVGKRTSPTAVVQNAWEGTGTPPLIGWTTWDSAAGMSVVPEVGNELSYSRTLYDVGGRVAMSIALDEDGHERPTGYKYDKAGRQVVIADAGDYALDPDADYTAEGKWHVIKDSVLAGLVAMDIETLPNVSMSEYEGNRRLWVADDRGNTTQFQYDALGRVTRTQHPDTVVEGGVNPVPTYTHVGYDKLGRKAWESEQTVRSGDAGDEVAESEKKYFYYDAAGRLKMVMLQPVDDPEDSPDAGPNVRPQYDYYYDVTGNQIGILDPKNRLTVFEYDELNQQTAKYMPFVFADPTLGDGVITTDDIYSACASASPDVEVREYDALGRLWKVTDFEEHLTVYGYNSKGLLEYESHYETAGDYNPAVPTYNADPEIYYVYDNLGRRQEVSKTKYDSGGVVISSLK